MFKDLFLAVVAVVLLLFIAQLSGTLGPMLTFSEISTDKQEYDTGEQMVISGTFEYNPQEFDATDISLVLELIDPEGVRHFDIIDIAEFPVEVPAAGLDCNTVSDTLRRCTFSYTKSANGVGSYSLRGTVRTLKGEILDSSLSTTFSVVRGQEPSEQIPGVPTPDEQLEEETNTIIIETPEPEPEGQPPAEEPGEQPPEEQPPVTPPAEEKVECPEGCVNMGTTCHCEIKEIIISPETPKVEIVIVVNNEEQPAEVTITTPSESITTNVTVEEEAELETETGTFTGIIEEDKEIKIKKGAPEKKVILESEGIEAETDETVSVMGKALKLGQNRVKVLPDRALKEIRDEMPTFKEETVKIKTLEAKPKYEVEGTESGNLLWVIPVDMKVRAQVDAGSGKVEKKDKPWWSFFVARK